VPVKILRTFFKLGAGAGSAAPGTTPTQ